MRGRGRGCLGCFRGRGRRGSRVEGRVEGRVEVEGMKWFSAGWVLFGGVRAR